MVEENEQEIQFYAQTKPQGIIRTALWKYDIGSRELHRCFEIRKRIAIWKYTVDIKESELKYLGISTIGEYYIIGLNDNGDMLFRYELDGTANYPVYDMAGNVYISVNNFWILCLSEKGKLLWKWKPICDHFYGIKGIKKYWIANEKLYVIAYDYLFVITSDGDTEASYIVNDFNDATQYEVQNDKIIFSSENYQELICCNFKAENLWRYNAGTNEMIFEIITNKKNMSFLRVKNRTDETTRLCVIDEYGKKLWDVMREWSSKFYLSDEQIVLIKGKSIVIYNNSGQELLNYSYKGDIIWGRLIADKLLLIVERQGNIAIVERNIDSQGKINIVELPIKEQTKDIKSSKNTYQQ